MICDVTEKWEWNCVWGSGAPYHQVHFNTNCLFLLALVVLKTFSLVLNDAVSINWPTSRMLNGNMRINLDQRVYTLYSPNGLDGNNVSSDLETSRICVDLFAVTHFVLIQQKRKRFLMPLYESCGIKFYFVVFFQLIF